MTIFFTPNYITNYAWTFGDGGVGTGNPITHQYDSASSFNVKLVITDVNGCKDSLTRNSLVSIFGPKANFAPSVPGSCLLSNITFNDLSITDGTHPITEWIWNYGEGTPQTYTAPPFTHAYPNSGLFAVTLTVKDSYGCTSTLTRPNLLTISQPVADFLTPNTPSCPNAPIVFTSTSVGPGLTYLWEFGDNTTSQLANPTHFYVQDGIYTVKLTVTDIYGCTDVETKIAYVRILTPVANFTVNQTITTCPPLVGLFTNTSINANLYEWDFGSGFYIPITNPTPSFTFNTPGVFTVKLRVTGAGGCTSIKTETITIRGPIGTFDYNPKNGCNPLLVNFIASTPDIVSIVNDYNDGFLSAPTTNLTASHTYTVPGMYIPKMILTDASGCTVAITGTDTIKVRGVAASFVADTLLRCNSGVVNFSNTSISNELITGYEWNFGDGPITSPEVSPSHVYTGTGIYTPSLTVTTQSGCVNQFAAPVPIKVVKTPEISIAQPINKCVPALMSFNGILLNADTSSINWQWVFNNGAIDTIRANGLNLNNISFPNAGIYAGTLLASNSSGCKDTAFTSLEIYPKPIVDAGADLLICKGTGQTLTATGGVSYIWSPSIGLSCTNCPNPIANPDSVKNYVVSGTSTLGCVNTDTVKVSVQYPFNMPDGNNGQLCIGKSKILTASGALTYDWSPSIGLNKVTGPVVTATPSVTTNYMVIGKDGKNCFSDTAYYFVKVFPIPTVSTSGDRTINIGQSITVTASVSSDVTTAIWTPPTGIVSTSFPSVTVKPNVDQQYKVTVSNAGGCTAEALVNVFVICDGANVFIPNTFSPNGDGNNEVFYPRGTGLFRIKNIKIFNRWGEQVFERYNFKANNESDGWDGTFKGQKLMPDVYVYIMDIQCENNSILTYKGNVALIK